MEHYNVEYLKDPEYQAVDKEYRQLLVDIKDEDKYSPKRRLMADRLDKLQRIKKRIVFGAEHKIYEAGGAVVPIMVSENLPPYDGSFLYPPRIEHKIQPASLLKLDNAEYIAEPKLNGSNTSVTITPDKVIAKERHNTFFAIPPKFDFRSLYRGSGNMCLCGEFMNKSKKGVDGLPFSGFVIWDITAYNGKILLGTTPIERLELLDRLYPSREPVTVDGIILFYHTDVPGIYKINSFLTRFGAVYDKIIRIDMVEGLVLKRRNSKLKPLTTETNNMQWAVKARKPTRNYKFQTGGGVEPIGGEISGVTTVKYEDEDETLLYGTKTNQTRISVKGLSKEDIKEEYEFEKMMLKKSIDGLPQMKAGAQSIQNLLHATLKEKKEALDDVRRTEKNIEVVKQIVIPFYEGHLKGKLATGGEILKHKSIPTLSIELLEQTNTGWKVKETDPKGIGKVKKGKIAFYSDAEIRDLFTAHDKKFVIRNADEKYFSRNLSTGKPTFSSSMEMGYTYTFSEANDMKDLLTKEGYAGLEVVPYVAYTPQMATGGSAGLKIGSDVKFMRGPHTGHEGTIRDVELRYKVREKSGKIIIAREGEIFNQD